MTRNPVYSFFHTPGSLGPCLLRLTLAAIFGFHACRKIFGWFGGDGWDATLPAWTADSGMNLPYVVAAAVVLLEGVASFALFLGLFTRLAALTAALIMGSSIFMLPTTAGFADLEYPLALTAMGLALVFSGAGALSIDRVISLSLLPDVG